MIEKMDGIKVTVNNNEVLISGTKSDLTELADYIMRVVNSNNEKDHIHIDELTLISKESEVKEIVVEKI